MKLSILLLGAIITACPAQAMRAEPLEEYSTVKFTPHELDHATQKFEETCEKHSLDAEKRIVRRPNGLRMFRSLTLNDEILEQQLIDAERKLTFIKKLRAEVPPHLRVPGENSHYNDMSFFW